MKFRGVRKPSKKEQRAFLLGRLAALQTQQSLLVQQIKLLIPEMTAAGVPVISKDTPAGTAVPVPDPKKGPIYEV